MAVNSDDDAMDTLLSVPGIKWNDIVPYGVAGFRV